MCVLLAAKLYKEQQSDIQGAHPGLMLGIELPKALNGKASRTFGRLMHLLME